MRRFFYDILRDKGSTKFSITKVLAFISFLVLVAYLIYQFFVVDVTKIDHTIVIELIGFILTLLGFKNGWGVKSSKKGDTSTTEHVFETKSNNTDDEATF